MEASVVYVGLDVHKDSIVIAVAREGREAAENWKTIPNDAVRSQKALKWLLRTGEPSRVGIAHRFLATRVGQAGSWSKIARGVKHKVVGVAHGT